MQRRTLIVAGLALAGGLLVLTTVNRPARGPDPQGSDPLATSSAQRPALPEGSAPEKGGAPAVQPGTAGPAARAAREGDELRTLPRLPAARSGRKSVREGKLPRGDENHVASAPIIAGGGGEETLAGGAGAALGGGGEPREEAAIDAQTLNEIATLLEGETAWLDEIANLLMGETAWLNGPQSGQVADALAQLVGHESLSENGLRTVIARVLLAGASMLAANDDVGGAELAVEALGAMRQDQREDARALVWEVVSWYPVDAPVRELDRFAVVEETR